MSLLREQLTALLKVILEEARHNQVFAARLESALRGGEESDSRHAPARAVSHRRPNRRSSAALDPFELFGAGEPNLREALAPLDVEQLKDIVAAYGMDRSRLALKWKSADRLIALIVGTVAARARKGTAFRADPKMPDTPSGDQ